MARAETYTLLPLDTWATLMGFSLWEFNQFVQPRGFDSPCESVWFQFEWQRDYLSREEIARAIASAEQMLAEHLNYYPAPKYIAAENVRVYAPKLPFAGGCWWGRAAWGVVQTRYHHVLQAGTLKREALGTFNVAYSDADGDGVNELFTVTFPTTVTNPTEIAVYFASADRAAAGVHTGISETWRVRPVRVTISAGTASVTGHAAMLVRPTLVYGTDVEALTATTMTNYVGQVEVYRVTTDTSTAGTAYWYPQACDGCDLVSEPLECALDLAGRVGQVAVRSATETCAGRGAPDAVTLNYLAGLPVAQNDDWFRWGMTRDYADIVAKLAAGLLPNKSCGCNRSDRILDTWRRDVTESPTPRALSQVEEMSPFGFTIGALYAWKRVYNDTKRQSMTGVAL